MSARQSDYIEFDTSQSSESIAEERRPEDEMRLNLAYSLLAVLMVSLILLLILGCLAKYRKKSRWSIR